MDSLRVRAKHAHALAIAALLLAAAATTGPAVAASAVPAPQVGKPAPTFTGTDSRGQTVSLADYRGSVVVLEWSNHECPFVQRHYDSGNMQAAQQRVRDAGGVWLTVISSAKGEQGYVSAAEANELTTVRGASPSAVILDPSGTIGRAYGAKTTPHMYVIDAEGVLAYMGAIDDQPRNAGADPATARNYVLAATQSLKDGAPVQPAVTQAYGCTIKYVN